MASTEYDIDDAVSKRHIQNTDIALGVQSVTLDMNQHKIIGLADPTGDKDATNKEYVDDHAGGNVVGPSSAINNAISLFDGITGILIKDSTRLIEDVLSDGSDIPDGHAIKVYGDANWGGVGGDVVGPSVHAASYVPQWNETPNSKILIEGFAITAAGKALLDDDSAATQRTTLELLSASLREAEDALTDGSNLPDGHAIKVYGNAIWVTGPASATNNNVPAFDGTTGKLIKDSGVALSDLVPYVGATRYINLGYHGIMCGSISISHQYGFLLSHAPTAGYVLTSDSIGVGTWQAPGGGGGGGYTNLTQFINQTPWRLFYSNAAGDVEELALGASGQYLKSNGIAAIPSWATPAGGGGGSPGGNDTEVQFNDSGEFAGHACFVFDKANCCLGVNTSVLTEILNVGGAIRLGNTTSINAGTIRWTGTDFEGYTGTTWISLTAGGVGYASDESWRTFKGERYTSFGKGSKASDPILIRVGGDDHQAIQVLENDSGGKGKRMLVVSNR